MFLNQVGNGHMSLTSGDRIWDMYIYCTIL